MNASLHIHIAELVCISQQPSVRWKKGAEMRDAEIIPDAFLWVEEGRIRAFGPMSRLPAEPVPPATPRYDCRGRVVLPGFVDCHTHLVFATTREQEFLLKLQGKTYEEIAAAGGGILNSARRVQQATEAELLTGARERLQDVIRYGTTALEIKSGYGLTLHDELKLLRVARQLASESPLAIRTTLLAAHALPAEYRHDREAFLRMVTQEMIPNAAAEGLADYVDVFCEEGFFTPNETLRILEAGARYGLQGRVHANELAFSGGVQAAVQASAASCDHLECVGEAEIQALLPSQTVPVLLPTTAFYLRIPYAPARQMIDSGLGVALATDYNPGTSPSGNMGFVVACACTQMRLLPAEALCAATLNSAHSLGWGTERGSLAVGKAADFIVTEPIDTHLRIPYHFGHSLIAETWAAGKRI
jgi:imidazolonepropionase